MQVNNTLAYRKFTQIVIEVKIQTHLLAKQKWMQLSNNSMYHAVTKES